MELNVNTKDFLLAGDFRRTKNYDLAIQRYEKAIAESTDVNVVLLSKVFLTLTKIENKSVTSDEIDSTISILIGNDMVIIPEIREIIFEIYGYSVVLDSAKSDNIAAYINTLADLTPLEIVRLDKIKDLRK